MQDLLRRVDVRPAADLTARFPAEHACRVRITLRDGRVLAREKTDYRGFLTRPAAWDDVEAKFRRLAEPVAGEAAADRIVGLVRGLERAPVAELCSALSGGFSR